MRDRKFIFSFLVVAFTLLVLFQAIVTGRELDGLFFLLAFEGTLLGFYNRIDLLKKITFFSVFIIFGAVLDNYTVSILTH